LYVFGLGQDPIQSCSIQDKGLVYNVHEQTTFVTSEVIIDRHVIAYKFSHFTLLLMLALTCIDLFLSNLKITAQMFSVPTIPFKLGKMSMTSENWPQVHTKHGNVY
jgi:hypothetical protein